MCHLRARISLGVAFSKILGSYHDFHVPRRVSRGMRDSKVGLVVAQGVPTMLAYDFIAGNNNVGSC